MSKLHERRPDIYKNNTCIICNREIDLDLHPLLCGINTRHLQNKYITFLTDEYTARANNQKQTQPIQDKWKNTQLFTVHKEPFKP